MARHAGITLDGCQRIDESVVSLNLLLVMRNTNLFRQQERAGILPAPLFLQINFIFLPPIEEHQCHHNTQQERHKPG